MNDSAATPEEAPCRVCQTPAPLFFTRTILGRRTIRYFKCPSCGHVQTEAPGWLEETYREATFELDVGMADRCIWTAQTMVALGLRLGIQPQDPCLDWGGGTGLFVRLCRDYGMNFFYYDPYAQNVFARGFEINPGAPQQRWACVAAFEVAEHFPDPMKNFSELFRFSAENLLFSTTLYQGEAPDWWYFGEDGQHVAFYTRRSLEIIGRRHGYHLASNGCDLHLFSRERVSDRLLDACRKSCEKLAQEYREKHGSRTMPDFEEITRRFRLRTAGKK
jgi:hypothetical protein